MLDSKEMAIYFKKREAYEKDETIYGICTVCGYDADHSKYAAGDGLGAGGCVWRGDGCQRGGKFTLIDTMYIKGANKQKTLGYPDLKTKKNGVKNGEKYAYKVIAVRTVSSVSVKSAASAAKATYCLAAPAGLKTANSATKTVKVTYAKNAAATGYQIRYSLKNNMSGAKLVKATGAKTVSATLKGLTKGKTYYVSVRSCKTVGKTTYYSAWSLAKSVKIVK